MESVTGSVPGWMAEGGTVGSHVRGVTYSAAVLLKSVRRRSLGYPRAGPAGRPYSDHTGQFHYIEAHG